MNLFLNKAHYPVTSLGPGRRIGIWFQGCSIGCAGCLSRDTWEAGLGEPVAVEELVEWCRSVAAGGVTGVTISGGEPFEQPAALEALLGSLLEWRRESRLELDILAYSGFSAKRLLRRHAGAVAKLDALISEPFVSAQAPADAWRGSRNQRLTCLTDLGRLRYASVPASDAVTLQLSVDTDTAWFIGIPRPGDLMRLESAAERHGVVWKGASWRA